MKLLKSKCERAWLFNVSKRGEELFAGMACFLPGCGGDVLVEIKGICCSLVVPHKAINSAVPVKVSNARLSLLNIARHE